MTRYPISRLRKTLNETLLYHELQGNALFSAAVADRLWDTVRMGVGDPCMAVADGIFIDYDEKVT